MKYAIAVIAAAALVAGVITCNHDSYTDLHQVLDQQVDLIRDCGEKVARARNPADVVCVIDRFSASMEKLSPRVQRLWGKYPELRNHLANHNIPDSFQKTMNQVKKLDQILFKANAKLMRFSGDPVVEAARRKLENAMNSASWRQSGTR